MNPKQEKKIREIIERSLSDSDEFTIKFQDDTLSIEPSKQSIFHHIGFITLIIVPVIAILWAELSVYSFSIAVIYFALLTYRYYLILKYQVCAVFNLDKRVMMFENNAWSYFIRNAKSIRFQDLGTIEFDYVKYDRWFGKGHIRLFWQNSKRYIPILETKDEFKAKRLKFILTEIVK